MGYFFTYIWPVQLTNIAYVFSILIESELAVQKDEKQSINS
jgi:hypothetical protein